MPSLLQKFRAQAGFTMIELLVVIAVIGVLSVAVLSSINPIEQINKGRDTRGRSDAAQLISAVDRYFAIHEKYPWNEANVDGKDGTYADTWNYQADTSAYVTAPASGTEKTDYRAAFLFDENDTTTAAAVTLDSDWAWTLPIVNTAEIKESFGNRLAKTTDNTRFLIVKPDGANRTMYTCFTPASYSFDLEATNRCTSTSDTYDSQLIADVPTACGDHDGDTNECWDDLNDEDKCMICLP